MKLRVQALRTSAIILFSVLLSVFAVVPAVFTADPAAAADDFYGPGMWHTEKGHKTWYGSYLTIDGRPSYCIDAGLPSPRPQHFKGSKAQTFRSPETAWLLATYSSSKSKHRQAALSAFVKLDKNLPHRHTMPVRTPDKLGANFQQAAEHYAQMRNDAKDFAGPYVLELVPTQQGETVSVKPLLKAASGKEVSAKIDVTITGGKQDLRKKVNSGDEVSVQAAAGAAVTLEASAAGLPSTDVRVYKPTSGARVQNVTTAGPTTVTAKATASTQLPYAPSATTLATLDGDKIFDSISISGAAPNSDLTLTARAYHVETEPVQSTEPRGKLISEQELATRADADGKAQLHTQPIDAQPGWTTWTVEIMAGTNWLGWTSDWGIPSETVFYEEPSTPEPEPVDEPEKSPKPKQPAAAEIPKPEEHPETPQPEKEPEVQVIKERVPQPGGTPEPQRAAAQQLPRTGVDWKTGAGAGLILLGIGAAATGFARKKA